MKPIRFFVAAIGIVVSFGSLKAQDGGTGKSETPVEHQMNFVKVNLTGIALKNYSLQYERVLNRRFSVAAAYRLMPKSSLPFASTISKAVGDDDPDTKKAIENLRMGNYAITPEARFYVGRGYGKGFYIALFYRYASYNVDHVPVDYDDTHSLDISGKLTANTGGLMFGAQWPLGKHLSLDWWIAGPHYGSGKGNFTGVASQTLNPIQQQTLKDNLENIDIPLTKKTVSVNANGATMVLDGPWGGVRAGILLGVKF